MKTHELKCWPDPFHQVWSSKKRFEIRKSDRGFEVGDILVLREWCPDAEAYLGRKIEVTVTCIDDGYGWGLPDGTVVLGIACARDHLDWRGVVDPCVRCGGAGQLMYGDSATWRRGGLKAGHQPTRDVCDLCWGTGDRWRIGVDLRRMRDEEDARIAAAAMDAVTEHAGVTDWNTARSLLLARTLRDLVDPPGRKRAVIEGSAGNVLLSLASLIERSANAPTPANPPGIRPSERARARHQIPEAERLIRAGADLGRKFSAECAGDLSWEALDRKIEKLVEKNRG